MENNFKERKRKKHTPKLTQEEKEFRKLQKEISKLPPPGFNNPEKAQPKVEIPKVVNVQDINKEMLNDALAEGREDLRREKVIDAPVILSKPAPRIERWHRNSNDNKIIKKVFAYAKPHWFVLSMALLFALLNSILELLVPILAGEGIDLIIGKNNVNFNALSKILIWLGLSAVGYAVTRWLANWYENILSYKTAQSMREDFFKKINKLPLKYLDRSSQGDLQSRMINDIEQITDGFLAGLTTFFDGIVSILLTTYLLFKINVSIATVIIVLTPITVVITAIIVMKSDKYFRKQAKVLGDISGDIVEMLGNHKVVLSFNYQDRAIDKFEKINQNLGQSTEKAVFYSSILNPCSRFVNGIIYGIVALMGTVYAISNVISIGSISVLLAYANKYIKPFNEISDVLSDLQSAYASARRVFNVLDIENEVSDENNIVLKRCKGTVDINDVCFSYTPTKKLIENFNAHIEKGQKVAIVGPTGCGKSTIINLLMRFYDVDSGKILVSNKSITDITRSSLRDKYGMVLQDTWLFKATIKENIAYGCPDATMEEIVRAAKNAYVHDFILTLEKGYDTMINESGDNLSQGQKQLICIARIMLTKPPMLILDEATSNIDTRTEMQIQNAFNKMMKGRTSFIVAHRLSTIVNSDVILVMNKGNIIEQGNHKELLKLNGFYANLYNSQFSKV